MNEKKKSVCKTEHFQNLFNLHLKVVRNYIYYQCGDTYLAEDITQEAFIKLWNNCEKVEYNKALFFLKHVSKNALINAYKHKKVVLNFKQNALEKTNIESPQFILEEKEFAIKVKLAIEQLPEKEREVFLLSRIDKKKYAEIAALLDISIKTVEKRMHNALVILRAVIGNV